MGTINKGIPGGFSGKVGIMSLEFNKCYGHKHYDMSRDARYMPVGIVNAMYVLGNGKGEIELFIYAIN